MVQGGPTVQILVIVVSVLGLWVGARLLVDAAVRLARGFGLSELVIGLTVVAVGTSVPELAVSLDAALKGSGDLAAGNVLGSNVYNLAFILGVVSMVRVVPVTRGMVHREGIALLASTLVGGLVLLDLSVSRLEGALLVTLFLAYTVFSLRSPPSADRDDPPAPAPEAARSALDRVSIPGRNPLFLLAGLALVLVCGDYMVVAASELARGAGISEWVIGGTIVSAGTSTPEFAVSLVAIRQGSLGVSIGNVVGSNVFNITGVLGLAGAVRPFVVAPNALETLAWLAVISVLMVAALWTGRALSRAEGVVFAASELLRWALGLAGRLG